MQETTGLAGLIQGRIAERLAEHRSAVEPLGPDALPLIDEASRFLTGGKRLRAQFAVLGYRSVRPLEFSVRVPIDEQNPASRLLDVAVALEFFHAAALIHDDIVDRSETRRGGPATHRVFTTAHEQAGWRGAAEHFGMAGAILLGDLLQSWADELLQSSCDSLEDRGAAIATRAHFNRMRTEVAVGQYLDVLEEQRPQFAPHEEQLERSTRLLVYKSAKYSVEAPLLIGAALAGASPEQESALAEFGLPVGVAFQLRDDLLGVFGDEAVTGKPTGDDLTEGKRTVLVALAREELPGGQRAIFDGLHGRANLEPESITLLQQTIRDSGAVDQVEGMIGRNVEAATEGITHAPLAKDAVADLVALAGRATRRTS
ncbi:geranylgeranyl pyrophosphate synthase [Leucobacter sp. Psy1]|uniref:polyprenyl synthetase family protein n=1 Tax=Leucobacter sp. Psy1 TaxID=2875729 RepID=UPI001CD5285A|nr:polyprenyl synthetase family protein [Leucobacter sp. Psy1]UBH06367.1 geranylgeranyl pyrophosphate synthase [Leucobacter sp. Psy1]